MHHFHAVDEELAVLADALAHPARVHLIRLLVRASPRSAGELVKALPLSQATVSRHLRVLREAGLVTARRQGRFVLYTAHPEPLRRIASQVGSMATTALRRGAPPAPPAR